MADRVLVVYGSYRCDRMGIGLANFIVDGLLARDDAPDFIDAKAVNLPMLEQIYKEYPKSATPPVMEGLAH